MQHGHERGAAHVTHTHQNPFKEKSVLGHPLVDDTFDILLGFLVLITLLPGSLLL